VTRSCPECSASLPPLAIRCECGFALPESRDARSDPDAPSCGVCGEPIGLMTETCPQCGAFGYPAMRARQGRKCQRAGDADAITKPPA
jgi:hypothetical protein